MRSAWLTRCWRSAVDLARATVARIRLNFMWAVVYNVVGIPVAAGALTPLHVTMQVRGGAPANVPLLFSWRARRRAVAVAFAVIVTRLLSTFRLCRFLPARFFRLAPTQLRRCCSSRTFAVPGAHAAAPLLLLSLAGSAGAVWLFRCLPMCLLYLARSMKRCCFSPDAHFTPLAHTSALALRS